MLSRYDLSSKHPTLYSFAEGLREVSGLTSTHDDRIFCHNDEHGIIYEVDPRTGEIVKNFFLGKEEILDDFESISIYEDIFYLCTSSGDILEFYEGVSGGKVLFNTYHTGLLKENDVEGMCYDPDTKSLLLGCKGSPGGDHYTKGTRTIYSYDLTKAKLKKKPRFILDMKKISKGFGLLDNDIRISDLSFHPISRTFFVLNHYGKAVIELSGEGEVLGAVNIPEGIHTQPEGITFSSDGTMYISNEGGKGKGTLVVYPMK